MGLAERCSMTWEKSKLRWRKMHKGKVYTVSCRELGTPESKEVSYRAANAWWEAKLATLGTAEAPQPTAPRHITLEMIRKRLRWAEEHGHPEIAADYRERLQKAEQIARHIPSTQAEHEAWLKGLDKHYPFPHDMEERIQHARELGMDPSAIDVPPLLDDMVGEGRIWTERFRSAKATQVPAEKSVVALSQRFLSLSEARVLDGDLSPSEHDLAHRCVHHFVEWLALADPAHITAEKWEDYWKHLRKLIADRKRSREYAKKDWRYARAFVEWLISMDKMPPLKNLHNKRYKIGETRKAVITFTNDEIKLLTKGATGQLKLHLLLMLNCGFYQKDISDLRKDEVDLAKGYITRQRSKTRQHHGHKIPTVSYKLWPITLGLLKVHFSDDPTLALTTLQGKAWVEEKIVDNRIKSRRDGIKSNFAHLIKRLKIDKPLKSFRKSSATRLDSKAEYARYAPHFLGHAGRTVAEENYINRDGRPFDEAVLWLGSQYELKP